MEGGGGKLRKERRRRNERRKGGMAINKRTRGMTVQLKKKKIKKKKGERTIHGRPFMLPLFAPSVMPIGHRPLRIYL